MTAPEMLAEFHAAFGQTFGDGGSDDACRARLHEEEYRELAEALDSGDRVAIAHKLADVVYVAYGTAHSLGLEIGDEVSQIGQFLPLRTCHQLVVLALRRGSKVAACLAELVATCYALAEDHGIDLDAVIAEIHRANMSKAGPDGRMVLDSNGKAVKPPGFRPADVVGVLARRGP